MSFIRVRSAGGPDHEYDVPEATLYADPDAYVVVDGVEPSDVARPPSYVEAQSIEPDPQPTPGPPADPPAKPKK
ncbi:hypothetical protein [Microbacterium sp. MMO-10]|uniref:hypothetical protein n=1 Tax=Microbacterium sp. MMO-10 TaxID=3081272 RepID=UPI003018D088